jgi:GT2 family glycosyltransferase
VFQDHEGRFGHERCCGVTQEPVGVSGAGLGAVVIGRNEGERLRRCLESLRGRVGRLVYVDSGSGDGSVALAAELGADVVELDATQPFSAARARNAGLERLRALEPDGQLVQFVDGDCEVASAWTERAAAAMASDPAVAVVCGRRRERHPDATIYNRLCDIEWTTPIGVVDACGGDALMRIALLAEVGGFDASLIAGEEPELCLRLRRRGYRILRIDAEMTLHDANIARFSQWWKRTVRSGYAYADGFAKHRGQPGRYCAKEVRSNFFWGALVPLLALVTVTWSAALTALVLAGYPLLAARVYVATRRRGFSRRDARLLAGSVTLGKVPSALGQLRCFWHRLRGRHGSLIEYKG